MRERLYVDDDMAGLLIYTASSDSAGSLGGVAAMAETDQLGNALAEGLVRLSWCSSDPVCIESRGAGSDALNLAACHACVLVPETSCEKTIRSSTGRCYSELATATTNLKESSVTSSRTLSAYDTKGDQGAARHSEVAAGERIVVRDEEWLVRTVRNTERDGVRVEVTGVSPLVRDQDAVFFGSLDTIDRLDPRDGKLVADDSADFRSSRLWLESILARQPRTGERNSNYRRPPRLARPHGTISCARRRRLYKTCGRAY